MSLFEWVMFTAVILGGCGGASTLAFGQQSKTTGYLMIFAFAIWAVISIGLFWRMAVTGARHEAAYGHKKAVTHIEVTEVHHGWGYRNGGEFEEFVTRYPHQVTEFIKEPPTPAGDLPDTHNAWYIVIVVIAILVACGFLALVH